MGNSHSSDTKSRRQKKIEKLVLTKKRVNLRDKLRDDDISVVASALARSTTLKVLDLGANGNRIGDAEVKLIADALLSNSNCKLQLLDLGWNNIADDGAKNLAEALCHSNGKLQKLYLEGNRIGKDGTEAFADMLRYDNRTLKKLNLFTDRDVSPALRRKIERLAEINSESAKCSAVEVGKKKRAEYGPTVDEVYSFVRSNPYLLSA